MGHETRVWYSPTWPGLPTRTISPTRLETLATYTSRGLVESVRVPAPYGNPADTARTVYEWHPVLNRIVKVSARTTGTGMHVQEQASYASDSTLAWRQRSDSLTRVTFSYTTTQTGIRVPSVMTQPGGATTTFTYDRRGNPRKVVSPLGYVTLIVNDALGRPVTTITPRDTGVLSTDSASVVATGVRTISWYDVLNRDTMQVTVGPRVTLSTGRVIAADTVRLNSRFDPMGRPTQHTRYYTRNADTTGTGIYALNPSRWVYDSLGRIDSTTEAGRGWRKYTYDKAGNVTAVRSPRNLVVSMQYDASNRLTRRITPQVSFSGSSCEWYGFNCNYFFPTLEGSSLCIGVDTARFVYDQTGGLRVADNNWARIRRRYSPGGSLLHEKQVIRSYETEASSPCGPGDRHAAQYTFWQPDWIQNVYELSYTYDLLGRRTTMSLPLQLDPCSGSCVQRYSYNSRGELSGLVHPNAAGDTVRTSFTYDASGRHTGTMSPGGVSVGTGYDLDGRVVSRAGAAFTLDAGGRIVFADLGYTSVQLEYNGLGALQRTGGLAQGLVEDYRTDALGSVLWVRDSEMVDGINRTKINTYNSATGQLLSAELGTPGVGSCAPYNHSCHPSWYVYEFGQGFDAAGNVTRSYEIETDALTQENTPTETRHYYDAADRLTFSNTMRGWIWFAGTGSGTFSDYRYDALGRRVLTRTRRVDATCATPCDAFIERTVYDGDQVLAEIRSSGQVGASSFVLNGEGVAAQGGNFNGWTDPTYPELFGVVLYAHGLGIDQPVHVLKRHPSGTWTGFTPLMDWRGHYYGGVRTDGSACTSSTCPTDWPSRLLNAYGRELGALPTTYASWYGSLLRNRKDANGLTYLRNRYYDPTTGQFTQPDPIGLAGGLNLYGYAGGDPINFSDPFGLCPKSAGGDGKTEEMSDCPRGSSGWWAYRDAQGEGSSFVNNAMGLWATFNNDVRARLPENTAIAEFNVPIGPRAGAVRAMQRQLTTAGRGSVERTVRTLTGRIAEHEKLIEQYRAAGGNVSSMEREIRAWRETIAAAQQVLGNP